jgi:two-component system, OmpR family, KDP operon response regulator KdpE
VWAERGEKGLTQAGLPPDLVLPDLGLPDLDGLEVTQRLREWSDVPIIVISARDQEKDKVRTLDVGADDYLTKPFGAGELLARIRVALRHRALKAAVQQRSVFTIGNLRVDLLKRQIFLNDQNGLRLIQKIRQLINGSL